MKVGLVAENYYPTVGGIQEHVYNLARWLRANGVEVRILTGDTGIDPGSAGPPDAMEGVIHLGRALRYPAMGSYTYMTFGPSVWLRARRVMEQEKFDVLHIHGPFDLGLPIITNLSFDGPRVYTLHSYFPQAAWRRIVAPLYRYGMSRSRAVIAVSEATCGAMARYSRFDATVIPNGVDTAYWASGKPWPRFADGLVNLLYVGRLEPRNGLDILLDAYERVAARRKDTRLIVIGDGPMRPVYERHAAAIRGGRVEFLGTVYRERADLYASARMMVIPARVVGFSILVLEALASGLPVVALPAMGVGQAGRHWSTTILAKDGSIDALADAIASALDADLSGAIARGLEIARTYDWSEVAPRVLEVYRRVISGD